MAGDDGTASHRARGHAGRGSAGRRLAMLGWCIIRDRAGTRGGWRLYRSVTPLDCYGEAWYCHPVRQGALEQDKPHSGEGCTMSECDIVIRGGTIVTAGQTARADVGIADGRVAQSGGDLSAAREIDATGQLLLPGAVDAHVHLSSPPGSRDDGPRWVDDFTSGSRAALAGGVTTLGNMTFLMSGETPLAGLEREAAVAREQTIADLFCHPVLGEITPPVLDEIPQLLANGCNTIKYFMSPPSFDRQVAGYVEATRRAGANELLTLIHCEDYALMADAAAQLDAAGRTALRYYGESRP